MPSVLLVGSKIRRRSSVALVGEMAVTSRRPSSTRGRLSGHRAVTSSVGAPGGRAGEKAWTRVGVRPAAARLGELSPKELEQLLGRPRDEPFDGVGEDVGALAVGELKLDRH